MHIEAMVRSATLLFVLLNPFLLSVYLLQIIRELSLATFAGVMVRGAVISGVAFACFAWLGDMIFRDVLHARFAAFLIFGGVVFLIIAVRFVFQGPEGIEMLRGEPEYLAGSVAMPFMIGPGTINASVLAGSRMSVFEAILSIVVALAATVVIVLVLKGVHDYVSVRNARLVDRYVDLCGRVSAMIIGTLAVEMIFQGVEGWLRSSVILGG
jgi:multiple antibiotic resistance protein